MRDRGFCFVPSKLLRSFRLPEPLCLARFSLYLRCVCGYVCRCVSRCTCVCKHVCECVCACVRGGVCMCVGMCGRLEHTNPVPSCLLHLQGLKTLLKHTACVDVQLWAGRALCHLVIRLFLGQETTSVPQPPRGLFPDRFGGKRLQLSRHPSAGKCPSPWVHRALSLEPINASPCSVSPDGQSDVRAQGLRDETRSSTHLPHCPAALQGPCPEQPQSWAHLPRKHMQKQRYPAGLGCQRCPGSRPISCREDNSDPADRVGGGPFGS